MNIYIWTEELRPILIGGPKAPIGILCEDLICEDGVRIFIHLDNQWPKLKTNFLWEEA